MTNRYDSSWRLGRCNSRARTACDRRPVFAWHYSTGLRLDDVRCPYCDGLLDKTSRDAHYVRALTDDEVVAARDAAIARTETRLGEYLEAASAWDDELTLAHEAGDEAAKYRAQFNYDRYMNSAAEASKTLKRLRAADLKAKGVRMTPTSHPRS